MLNARPTRRRPVLTLAFIVAIGLLAVLTLTGGGPAFADAPLPLPARPPGGGAAGIDSARNIEGLIREALDLPDPSIRESAAEVRRSFAVVFVPGILGSSIADGRGEFWGPSTMRPERLRLAEPWITSDDADGRVTVAVLERMFGEDQYGEALGALRAGVEGLGLGFYPCGYDWRRDPRAGAAYLQRCLEQHRLLDSKRTVFFVAHSMGGLVTWAWHDRFHRGADRARAPRVRGVLLLGSPVEGSCEMLRMMRYGYTQPVLRAQSADASLAERARRFYETKRLGLVNKLTAFLSRMTVRPAMFTWPGAFALLPGRVERLDDACVSEADPEQGFNVPWAPLEANFWQPGKPGAWILDGLAPPPEMPLALRKAREFREWFRQGERAVLTAPTFVFRSSMWFTYSRLVTIDSQVAEPPFDGQYGGDGRVTRSSAMMLQSTDGGFIERRRAYSDPFGTSFVHGSLPLDPVLGTTLVERILPMVANASVALAIAERLAGAPEDLLRELVRRLGDRARLQWNVVFTHLELTLPHDPRHPETRYPGAEETERERAPVERFNEALRTRGGLGPKAYAEAKAIQATAQRAPAAPAFQQAAAALGLVTPGARASPEQAVFARANRGLALAQAQDYLTAAAVLLDASQPLQEIPDTFDTREPGRIRALKEAVARNLGIALYEIGHCEAAARYLATAPGHDRVKPRLEARCRDRTSGEPIDLRPTKP